jgi:hypothetical protein
MIRGTCAFLVALALMAGSISAEPFVSLNGKFHFVVPADWYRVDYRTVDYYLSLGNNRRAPKYEVALAPKGSNPWNAGAYVMVTVESRPNPTPHLVDSILTGLAESVEKPVNKNAAGPAYEGQWRPDEVSYWPASQVGAVSMEPTAKEDHTRTQIVLKFYNLGIANFYCYAPDSLWTESQPVFAEILASFSTENLDSVMPKETLKVADAERLKGKPPENHSPNRLPIYIGIGVVIIALIVAGLRRARRIKTTQQ